MITTIISGDGGCAPLAQRGPKRDAKGFQYIPHGRSLYPYGWGTFSRSTSRSSHPPVPNTCTDEPGKRAEKVLLPAQLDKHISAPPYQSILPNSTTHHSAHCCHAPTGDSKGGRTLRTRTCLGSQIGHHFDTQ